MDITLFIKKKVIWESCEIRSKSLPFFDDYSCNIVIFSIYFLKKYIHYCLYCNNKGIFSYRNAATPFY